MYTQHVSLIRDVREAEGLTQAELADRLGITQPAVARLEAPGANPRIRTLYRALKAMGRELQLLAPGGLELDVGQIDERLKLTPAERLQAHQAGRRNVADLSRKARRVDVG